MEAAGTWRVCIDFWTRASSASVWVAADDAAAGAAWAHATAGSSVFARQTYGIARRSGRSRRRDGCDVIAWPDVRFPPWVPPRRYSDAEARLNRGCMVA